MQFYGKPTAEHDSVDGSYL